jgi:antitoxin VapB
MEPYMTLSIRNPEADALARRLAKIGDTTVTEAVILALREAIAARVAREDPSETARRILKRHGLSFPRGRRPVPPRAYHDLDHDLTSDD